jgi:MoaA/NifB/PqqE/SkfB family radical SAM enzyme
MYTKKPTHCHIELTTKCNAACPLCPRTTFLENTNNQLPTKEIDLEFFKRIYSMKGFEEIRHWEFCGNYGDPIFANHLIDIASYIRNVSNHKITIRTNASIHPPKWWENLAKLNCDVIFAIDGIKDTHEFYRRNTSYDTVIENAKAYINAGGAATWQFIPFLHSEHEQNDCIKLAKDLGFTSFITRVSNRFITPKGVNIKSRIIIEKNGEKTSISEPNAFNNGEHCITTEDEYFQSLLNSPVDCRACKDGLVYISSQGYLFPCCYLGHIYFKGVDDLYSKELMLMLKQNKLSISILDLRINEADEILNHPVYKMNIPNSWKDNSHLNPLRTCKRVCGIEKHRFAPQTYNQKIDFNESSNSHI